MQIFRSDWTTHAIRHVCFSKFILKSNSNFRSLYFKELSYTGAIAFCCEALVKSFQLVFIFFLFGRCVNMSIQKECNCFLSQWTWIRPPDSIQRNKFRMELSSLSNDTILSKNIWPVHESRIFEIFERICVSVLWWRQKKFLYRISFYIGNWTPNSIINEFDLSLDNNKNSKIVINGII